MRTETTHSLADLSATDIAALVGAPPNPRHVVAIPAWSRAEAAIAAASLANTAGGLVIIGASAGAEGGIGAIVGADVAEEELAAVAADLGAAGRHLIEARLFDVGGERVGVLKVAESGDTPVILETDGGIYCRGDAGLSRVTSRIDLDQLYEKARGLRERAVTNIEGLVGRVAFGHFNYMTIAVATAPRFAGPRAYEWALQHQAAILDPSLGFIRRWQLDASDWQVAAGEITAGPAGDDSGFIRIVRNGCVAVGQRTKRPAQDRFLAPAEFAALLAEMVEVLGLPQAQTRSGLVLGAVFMEGVRDLRLPVPGGLTAPVRKDLIHAYVPERYLEDAAERSAFLGDIREVVGEVFSADLANGTGVAYAGPVSVPSADPRTWHGTTKRTERRLAGARGHGSV